MTKETVFYEDLKAHGHLHFKTCAGDEGDVSWGDVDTDECTTDYLKWTENDDQYTLFYDNVVLHWEA